MKSHYAQMIPIMILSGLLSSMYIWADSLSDIRLSINDIYMTLLMTGWMIFFMSIQIGDYDVMLGSAFAILGVFVAIRSQAFVDERQFLLGMIPHHSMAIHMSKKLQEKKHSIPELLEAIISSQKKEIEFMKARLTL